MINIIHTFHGWGQDPRCRCGFGFRVGIRVWVFRVQDLGCLDLVPFSIVPGVMLLELWAGHV